MLTKKFLSSLILFTSSSLMFAADVTDDSTLNTAIINANTGADTMLNFQNDITLTNAFGQPLLRPLNTLPNFTPVAQTLTINGNGFALNGGGSFRGLFVRGGNVEINNLTFVNTQARGGAGGNRAGGGGGGGGFGGALYISEGTSVTLLDPSFTSSNAIGGIGGTGQALEGGGGGGGLTGNGSGINSLGGNGGGGFAFAGGDGDGGGGGGGGTGNVGSNSIINAGGDGGPDFSGAPGGAGGASLGDNGNPGSSGTGGGGGAISGDGGDGGDGGGGGGGGGGDSAIIGGDGGIGGAFAGGGGGGRGGAASNGGNGGSAIFSGGGGGGGGGTNPGFSGGSGGEGGFGGGGGGGGGTVGIVAGSGGLGGLGGFGGGGGSDGTIGIDGVGGAGGGGAGFGGAIFLEDNSSLTILNSATFEGNTVDPGPAGGAGAGDGLAMGADIFMMSSSQINFDIEQNVNIPTPIEGNQGLGIGGPESTVSGGLFKQGCAILTLNGDNTYTGETVVNGGELRINGSVVTDVTVNSDGILSGNATIKKNSAGTNNGDLINAGIVSPGVGGVGQITVEGDFTNESTGVLVIDITPNGAVHDALLIDGTAQLNGGTLNVIVNAGNYIAGTQYEIINAPTTGTFAQIIESGADANLIDIGVTYNSVILTILESRIFQDQVISGGIANSVAACIRVADITPRSDFAIIVEQLGLLSSSDVSRALFNLAPVNYGALDWINARNNSYVADILSEHLFQLCCSPRNCCGCDCNMGVWIDVFGNWMDNKKRFDNLSPFTANALGVVTGLDWCFCQNYTLGVAVGYTHTWLDWKKHYGNGQINSYYGALYGSYQGCWLTIDASILGGGSDHDLKRKIKLNAIGNQQIVDLDPCDGTVGVIDSPLSVAINRSAKSDPWGYFFTGHLGISADWECGCTTFEPFGLVDYHYFQVESFKEYGADSLNLKVKKHDQNMLRGEAGLRAYYTWVCECYCVAPYIGVSWVGEFPLEKSKQRASFVGQDCVFDVTSFDSSVQLGSPEVGIKWTQNSGFSFSVGYKGLFNSKTSINQVDARLEWVF